MDLFLNSVNLRIVSRAVCMQRKHRMAYDYSFSSGDLSRLALGPFPMWFPYHIMRLPPRFCGCVIAEVRGVAVTTLLFTFISRAKKGYVYFYGFAYFYSNSAQLLVEYIGRAPCFGTRVYLLAKWMKISVDIQSSLIPFQNYSRVPAYLSLHLITC